MQHSLARRLLGGAALLVSFANQAALAASDAELARMKDQLERTQNELTATRSALERLATKVEALEASRGSGAGAEPATPRIPPVNIDNPAISFVVDTIASSDTKDQGVGFELQSGELFLSAPIDPFVRGYAVVNGSSDEGFDLEEAALVTTALPGNFTVKGGRFFADVGRLPHWHDEALPFVNRPPSIDRLIGGESGAEGVEVTWLAPIEHYLSVTTGVYNAIGNERREQLRDFGFSGRRSFSELTWLVHPSTYFDLSDAVNLELGGTFATIPHDADERQLYGVDATLRHQPGTSGFYQGLIFGSEWFWNRERFDDVAIGFDPDSGEELIGSRRFARNGGYGYVEGFFGRRYSLGLRGDYSQAIEGDVDRLRTYSAFATWMPSEFQRLRFQYDFEDAEEQNNSRFSLQWTAFLGSHSHGFSNR